MQFVHFWIWHDIYFRKTNTILQNVLHLVSEENRLVRGIDAFSGVYSYNVNVNPGIPTALAIFDTENLPNLPGKNSLSQSTEVMTEVNFIDYYLS